MNIEEMKLARENRRLNEMANASDKHIVILMILFVLSLAMNIVQAVW